MCGRAYTWISGSPPAARRRRRDVCVRKGGAGAMGDSGGHEKRLERASPVDVRKENANAFLCEIRRLRLAPNA